MLDINGLKIRLYDTSFACDRFDKWCLTRYGIAPVPKYVSSAKLFYLVDKLRDWTCIDDIVGLPSDKLYTPKISLIDRMIFDGLIIIERARVVDFSCFIISEGGNLIPYLIDKELMKLPINNLVDIIENRDTGSTYLFSTALKHGDSHRFKRDLIINEQTYLLFPAENSEGNVTEILFENRLPNKKLEVLENCRNKVPLISTGKRRSVDEYEGLKKYLPAALNRLFFPELEHIQYLENKVFLWSSNFEGYRIENYALMGSGL